MCKKSESISQLAVALVKAQSEIKSVSKDGNNPHFRSKYATLDNIIDETRPILAKYGLAILQMPGGDGENVIMRTLLMHESGEWLETEPLIMRPVKNDPQGMGSCITYARRYSYSSLLSISTDEDDDGNAASKPPVDRTTVGEVKAKWITLAGNDEGFQEWHDKQINAGYTNADMNKTLAKKIMDKKKESV